MRWSVILASLKHSHCLNFASHCPRSKAALSSLQSRVFENSSPFQQTPRSSSQVSAILNSSNGSTSRVTVRAVTTIAKLGSKASSAPQGKTAKERLSSDAPSTQGNTKSTRSLSKKKDTSSALPAAKRVFKAAHAEDENPHIAYLDSSRTHGNRDTLSSNHVEGQDNRRSMVRSAFDVRNKKFAEAASSVGQISRGSVDVGQMSKGSDDVVAGKFSARMSKGTKSTKEIKAKPKARSYEYLLDASVVNLESKGSSKGQVLSEESSFGSGSKAGNVIKRHANSVGLSEEDTTAFASSDSSKSRLDCLSETEVTPECFDEGGENVGDKLKKSFLKIQFPVTVFAEWWFYCFLRGYRPYPETFYCLDKLYVWLGAYQRAHLDATGIYVNGHCASVLSKELEDLQNAVTSKVFKWGDTKHIYLHSPLGSARKSSTFLSDVDTTFIFQDRVVQEVLYLILEPIFEARFSTRSHASRPSRGAHTALRAAQRSFLGCKWFISGDLSILQEGDYATHLVDSVLRVVKDSRVALLLHCAFLGGKSGEVELKGMCSLFLSATQGSCGKLKHLLCNVLLDPLDWWMDEQISNFAKREPLRTSVTWPSDQSSKRELFKPLRNCLKHPCKLEYVRYGTKFWVGCDGTEKEVYSIQKDMLFFLKKKFGNCLEINLSVSHISAGVNILDHVISQKIVHPVYMRRRASSGRLFEKRAFRIRLCAKASMECCSKYLKQMGLPASLQHIEEVLSVLDYWYCCAENKVKVLMYCKLVLCHMYTSKGSIDKCKEGSIGVDVAEHLKKAVGTVVCPKSCPDGGKSFIRIPEHEKVFREHAWLQSRAMTLQLKDSFKNMRKTSPQQSMSQVLWQYLKSGNGDNGWDLVAQMQTSGLEQGSVVEELAESAG